LHIVVFQNIGVVKDEIFHPSTIDLISKNIFGPHPHLVIGCSKVNHTSGMIAWKWEETNVGQFS
jgi:hypothetical protein